MGNGGVRDSLSIQSFFRDQVDLAGRQFGIDGLGRTPDDRALHGHDVFAAQQFRAGVHLLIHFTVEDNLRDPRTVAQVDKNQAAQITAAMHPPHQDSALADIPETQLAAGVSAALFTKQVQADRPGLSRLH